MLSIIDTLDKSGHFCRANCNQIDKLRKALKRLLQTQGAKAPTTNYFQHAKAGLGAINSFGSFQIQRWPSKKCCL